MVAGSGTGSVWMVRVVSPKRITNSFVWMASSEYSPSARFPSSPALSV